MRKKFTSFDSFSRDSTTKKSFLCAFLFCLASTIALAIFYWRLPPVVPLWYSCVRGEKQLALKQFLVLIPVLSFISLLLHLWLSRLLFRSERMLSKIIATTSVFISFLFFLALIHILIIVI